MGNLIVAPVTLTLPPVTSCPARAGRSLAPEHVETRGGGSCQAGWGAAAGLAGRSAPPQALPQYGHADPWVARNGVPADFARVFYDEKPSRALLRHASQPPQFEDAEEMVDWCLVGGLVPCTAWSE